MIYITLDMPFTVRILHFYSILLDICTLPSFLVYLFVLVDFFESLCFEKRVVLYPMSIVAEDGSYDIRYIMHNTYDNVVLWGCGK